MLSSNCASLNTSVFIILAGICEDGLTGERIHPRTQVLFPPQGDQRNTTVNMSWFCYMNVPDVNTYEATVV